MLKTLSIFVVGLMILTEAKAQKKDYPELDEKLLNEARVSRPVHTYPRYGQGTGALTDFIEKNLQYNIADKEQGGSGIAYIGFIVEKDGSLSNFKVLRSPSPTMEAEALRVIKAMQPWQPATIKSKPVRLPYVVSVDFNRDSTAQLNDQIYSLTDTPPDYSPDMTAFYKFFSGFVHYPRYEMLNNITGKVLISFVIEKNGALSNLKFISSPSMGLGEEALKVVRVSRGWIPGTVNGAPVRTRFTMPLAFTLGVE